MSSSITRETSPPPGPEFHQTSTQFSNILTGKLTSSRHATFVTLFSSNKVMPANSQERCTVKVPQHVQFWHVNVHMLANRGSSCNKGCEVYIFMPKSYAFRNFDGSNIHRTFHFLIFLIHSEVRHKMLP